MGAEGAVGGALASVFRQYLPRALTAAYTAPGSEARVLVGDTAAGAGSGAAMQAYEEYVPDKVKSGLGLFGDLIAGLAGGVGGASAARNAEALGRSGKKTFGMARTMPESTIPPDPITQRPTTRHDFGQAAHLYRRSFRNDQDFAKAKRNIEDYLADVSTNGSVGPGPHPTTALVQDDPSQLYLEKKARSILAPEFAERDRSVMADVSEKLQSVRPKDANAVTAREAAEDAYGATLRQSEEAVAAAEGAVAGQDQALFDLANELTVGRSLNEASRDLDRVIVEQTYKPERALKNELFTEATSDPSAVVGTSHSQAVAAKEAARIDGLKLPLRNPKSGALANAFADPLSASGGMSRIPNAAANGGAAEIVRPLSSVVADRSALSGMEAQARANSGFELADTARVVREGLNQDISDAAASGAPGTQALAAADANYKTRFAPYFRDGHVSPKFFRSIDSDPSRRRTPPEATASKFLTAGSTSRAAAADVTKILEISPSRQEGLAAARDYVIADAVSKGVVVKGKVSEVALARFLSKREGMLTQLPELKQHFDQLQADVRTGNTELNALAQNLKDAQSQAKLTERELNSGALKLLMDTEPSKAVGKVFANQDPPARMRELAKIFDGNLAAKEGWKAAVADYLYRKVTTANKAQVPNGYDAASLSRARTLFDKQRTALAEIFSPEEMQTLAQAQKRLEILSRRLAPSAGDANAVARTGGLQAVLKAMASPIGTVTTVTKGALVGGSYERRVRRVAELFPDGNAAAREIIHKAMFDPELALHLMNFPTTDQQVYTWSRKLNQLLVLGESGE